MDPRPLFHQYELRLVLDSQERRVIEAAQEIPEGLALTTAVEQLTAKLVEKFKLEPLMVDWEAVKLSHHDVQIDAQGYGRGSGKQPGTTYTYHVPFKGDGKLFDCKPTQWESIFPVGIVASDELRVSETVLANRESDPKAALDSEVGKIKLWVDRVNTEVAAFAPRLLRVASEAAQVRHDKVVHDKEVADSFGLPQKP